MGWLLLLLESAGIAAAIACLVSLASWGLLRRVDAQRVPPARRADLALLAGVSPMLVALGVLVALSLPSLLQLLGLQADHCIAHPHHRHLCALHGFGQDPVLVLAGVAALVTSGLRGLRLAASHWRASRSLAALERLGTWTWGPAAPLVLVPGSTWLSLAVGLLRPRVLMSAALRQRLDEPAFAAVIAHEEAHLHRRDPQALALLGWASLFAAPWVAPSVRAIFREAAEEASDAVAAEQLGGRVVARALVAVARLHRPPPTLGLAFGATSVERRVRALIEPQHASARSFAARIVLAAALGTLAFSTGGADLIHHAVESWIQ